MHERYVQREKEGYSIQKDFFDYKLQVEKRKNQLNDENELLLIEKKALEDQLEKVKTTVDTDKQHAVSLYKKKTDNFAERFRKTA